MAERKLKLYKSYTFGGQDHDPVIDQMRTLMQDEGLNGNKIAELSGLSTTTISNWFNRKRTKSHKPTMRPQFASVMAFTRSVGYDLRFVKPERRVSAGAGVTFQRNIRAKSNSGNIVASLPQ